MNHEVKAHKALKLLVVVQRYGVDVNGGAEQHARWLSEGLSVIGHEVHVLTTCARDYTTWANHYQAGVEHVNGITVHRELVDEERSIEAFNSFSSTLDWEHYNHSRSDEQKWLRLQGPLSSGLGEWLKTNGPKYDVVIPFTYLYRSAHEVLAHMHERTPIVMHATAHHEKEFYLPTIQELLKKVDHFLCSTPEEARLLQSCGKPARVTSVVGIGVPPRRKVNSVDRLNELGLRGKRFILILGRVDGSKGVVSALDYVDHYRKLTGDQIHLVVAGQNVAELESNDSTTFTGYVSDDEVTALLDQAECLIQPSPAESFSLVLCEAWALGTPSLANKSSEALAGQTFRSQGGLTYSSQKEFCRNLKTLLSEDKALVCDLDSAANYVQTMFNPEVVIERIDRVLQRVVKTSTT